MSNIQSIECPICFDIFRDPRVFFCGHTICRTCIFGCYKEEYLTCPICRQQADVDDPMNISKNYSLAGIIPEFLKLKKESDYHTKIQETHARQNEDLRQQIKNLQTYLEISSGKLKIAEANFSKKKQEVEKLYKEVSRLEKKQIDGKCTVHNNIIVKLEMKVEDLSCKLRTLISIYKENGNLSSDFLEELEFDIGREKTLLSEYASKQNYKEFDELFSVKSRLNDSVIKKEAYKEFDELFSKKSSLNDSITKKETINSFELSYKPLVRLPSVYRSRSIVKQILNEDSLLETDSSNQITKML